MTPVPKRILFVMPSLRIGGAERVMVTLLHHLDRSRFEPHLALVEKAGPYLEDVPPDVPVHDLKATRVRWAVPKMIRLAWELKPHVLHSSMPELNMATVLSRPFLPPGVRVLIREEVVGSVENARSRKHPAVWNWLYRRLYSRADKVICLSEFVLNDLAENLGIPRRVLVHIYAPVDTELVARLGNEGGNPFEGKGTHILAAGRLEKRKGFDMLLDAMPRVCAAVPGARLTILGEGVLKQELLAQRERLGLNQTVRFVDYQPNPFPHFKHADLFVLSSTNEGFGLVVVEALAVGTPVVAADCGGVLREILRDCPLGWVAPPGGPSALAETIISALKALSGQPQLHRPLESFLNRFDVRTVMRDYESLLES
ncbi:MAG: glycosyltransferase [Terriglobia bacterium]|jgi:glycosyltransferase involved in cell wall biosynthesis